VLCNLFEYPVFDQLYDLIGKPKILDEQYLHARKNKDAVDNASTWPQEMLPFKRVGKGITYRQSMHMNDYQTEEDPRLFNHKAYYPSTMKLDGSLEMINCDCESSEFLEQCFLLQ